MRSDKEQMTASKDKGVVEIKFRDASGEQDNIPKHKEEKKELFTKVVIRRLPPHLTKEQLEEQLSPLPSYDYFEFFPADPSLYPHLFSRAYINFKNQEDILLFRDRFDGYVFIDSKGQEFPAVVEFAPFQKVSKKKLKKKDAKAGSIEEDPEYKRFLENYSCDEEKSMANPETLLGEIEAKTRELIAKRTTPLLEYIRNKKMEKQRMREEKREERRRREFEKKRQREEEKRKRREEERRKRKEADKQKKLSDKDVKIKLLKKSDRDDDDADSDRVKDKSDVGETERGKWEKAGGQMKLKDSKENRGQPESDKEQQQCRRPRDKEHRGKDDDRKRQRHHYDFDKFARRKDETKWGKGYCQDRAKKEGHHHAYAFCPDSGDKQTKEDRDELANRKERLRNKDWTGTVLNFQMKTGRPCSCTSPAREIARELTRPAKATTACRRPTRPRATRGVASMWRRCWTEPLTTATMSTDTRKTTSVVHSGGFQTDHHRISFQTVYITFSYLGTVQI
ncbi:regulator of nonsense transcripts 3A isoform X3 [Phycodurus eques]|uniref:regulator of nonsense transcripts 3A isoform X3 n=1 Tax=Phycodurus eques TaxID=693459 RepID=UPI002ACE5C19|nr:regulator of nonsense transcripts 3A isoform X3 [Phycodurus eques]